MIASYEAEHAQLESRVTELKKLMATEKESSVNVGCFLTLVVKYTDVQELIVEIIREFVEKIYVYKTEKVDGQMVQHMKIVWNCIGKFTLPTIIDNEKLA